VQERGEEWGDVWNKVEAELYDSKGKWKLASSKAVRDLDLKSSDRDAFIAFVVEEFREKVSNGRLLAKYEPEKGSIYAFLRAKVIILHLYLKYDREVKGHFHIRVPRQSVKDKDTFEAEFQYHCEKIENRISANQKALCSSLLDEKLTLQLSDKKGFKVVHKDAGLQLYPQLDDTLEQVGRLINEVHGEVRKQHAEPSLAIEHEHLEAKERLDGQTDRYSDEIFNNHKDKKKPRNVKLSVEQNARRKLRSTEIERVLYPLAAEQMMRLLGLERNNADQRHKRYREELPKLLSEQDKKVLRAKLDIPTEEGGDDD
jgi:hypothetical protein